MQNIDHDVSRAATGRALVVISALGIVALCTWLYSTYARTPVRTAHLPVAAKAHASDEASSRHDPALAVTGVTASTAIPVPAAPLPPIVSPTAPAAVAIAAPLEALHGTSFSVTMTVAPRLSARSAKFRLHYDVDALELVDIVDSAGTTLAVMPNGDGSVDLDIDDFSQAARAPAARFLVRITAPRTVEFTATAELTDVGGRRLETGPIAPAAMMLVR